MQTPRRQWFRGDPLCSILCNGQQQPELPSDPRGGEVVLHVYDFADSGVIRQANSILHRWGTGAYHVGVEVYGWEWSFGTSNHGSGVFYCVPANCERKCYREAVRIGKTTLSATEVDNIIRRMEQEWLGVHYDLMRRNCVHFCESLCRRIVKTPNLPKWISTLPVTGAKVQDHVGHAGRLAEAAVLVLQAAILGRGQGMVQL